MWQGLVKTFDLHEKVEAFVFAHVRELVADRHDFEFCGSNRSGIRAYCDNPNPHPPHGVGGYDTVRYGWLQRFCLGREGDIPGQGRLHIVVTGRQGGAPEYPGMAKGYWFMTDTPADISPCETCTNRNDPAATNCAYCPEQY